jgi:Phage derived protein Gp49-like (DUF891).
MPGREFLNSQNEANQAKMYALFQHLADTGQIRNHEKFRKLTDTDLFEFKSHQLRLLGDFRPGGRFVVASGIRKKSDKPDKRVFSVTERILEEHDAHD